MGQIQACEVTCLG